MKLGASIVVAALLALAGCAEEQISYQADDIRPPDTSALTAPVAEGSLYLFQDRDFRGNSKHIPDITTATVPGQLQEVGTPADNVTSLRWNLPHGVVVVFYEDAGGRGNQIAIWGSGQMASVSPWKFNDKVSRWAWHYIGQEGVSASLARGLSQRPPGAEPTAILPRGTIELYRDAGFGGDLTTVGPIAGQPQAEFHTVGRAADTMTSLRWNLPPGVLVILYEDAQGLGRQLPLWGSGQYESVSAWNFNDKLSRWAWYDVGAPREGVPASYDD